MKRYPFLFIIVISLFGIKIQAQQAVSSFTPEPQAFAIELGQVFQTVEGADKKLAEAFYQEFLVFWGQGGLNELQQQQIYSVMNNFLKLRLQPWPDYALYLDALMKFSNTPDYQKNFDAWHNCIIPLMDIRYQKQLIAFLERSKLLFTQGILYESTSVKWTVNSPAFLMECVDGKNYIDFKKVTLTGYSQGDSTRIEKTSGRYSVSDNKWEGEKGLFTWERTQLAKDKVYAELSDYKIDLKGAQFKADSVLFYNKNFFNYPIIGVLTEKVLAEVKAETATFPRFDSYLQYHEILGLFPDIDYNGGFSMQGSRVIGSGTSKQEAYLNVWRHDSLLMRISSRVFSIREDRLVSEKASVTIYYSGDSIYHPGLNVRYLHNGREFSFIRDVINSNQPPFYNTFHKVDMYCEGIFWKMDEQKMELKQTMGLSKEGEAFFESRDYFSELRYHRLQGADEVHPLIRIRDYSNRIYSREFTVEELARGIKMSPPQVKSLVGQLTQYGFLSYNSETELITLHDRLFDNIQAKAGRKDYDIIRIRSVAPVNAYINLSSFDLELKGVEKIPLSEARNVVIYPYQQQLMMTKNRDMYFHGKIESGLFDFYGKEFFFEYNPFKINLINTDSMTFYVESRERNERGEYPLVKVRTVLEAINGDLLVDNPRNKSGNLPYPRYPIFNSNNESFVYYDKEYVQSGSYNRENFYFKLIPFTIDSLDNATTDNIRFNGVFISTGVFPDFYDYLTVQHDYSLGFNSHTPPEGYPVYGEKGQYYGPIDMSFDGLVTNGKLEFLNATFNAEHMIMFLDSARAITKDFTLEPKTTGVEYPGVKGESLSVLWLPHQDEMYFSNTNKEKPIQLFDGLATFNGEMKLTPEDLGGKGKVGFYNSELTSEDYTFKNKELFADKSNLKIFTPDGKNTSFEFKDYSTYADFENARAEFKSNSHKSTMDFPINRYSAYVSKMEWDLKSGMLSLLNEDYPDLDKVNNMSINELAKANFNGYEYVSQHPSQEGLKFFSSTATYDVNSNMLHCTDVKVVKVADAAIYPSNNELFVLPRAEIKSLGNAVVLANRESQYHQFYNAKVNILGSNRYDAVGYYDYIDETQNAQQVFFDKIQVGPALITIASGVLEEKADFTISPYFKYKGNIQLYAPRKHLQFVGSTMITEYCDSLKPGWLKFDAIINPDSVYIPLTEKLENDANAEVFEGVMIGTDPFAVYTSWYSRKKHYADILMLPVSGSMFYEKLAGEYRITSSQKVQNANLPDAMINFIPKECRTYGEGYLTVSNDFGQFKCETYGEVNQYPGTDSVALNMVMAMDFFFHPTSLAIMEDAISKNATLQPINLNRFKYTKYLSSKVGVELSDQLITEYSSLGSYRDYPKELEHTIFLADVKFRWDKRTRSFISYGKIGIGSIGKQAINKYVNGYIQIKKQRGGDLINVYLQPSEDKSEYYYFSYARGLMQAFSSNNDFNIAIQEAKPKQKVLEVEKGEETYTYLLSSDRRIYDFLREVENR